MTLIVKRHRRPRWAALAVVVVTLSGLMAVGTVVTAHSGVNSIPSNYFTVVDSGGVNDVNSDQVDLTQMGRDDTDSTKYSLFWSWDSINSWTGSGQTGDACALFDTGTDGKIDKAVCARVNNPNADPNNVQIVPQDATHPVFLFNCSNAKNDRCAQPSAPLPYTVGTQITAGALAGSTIAPNLITDTDPFPAGQSNPHDSSIAITVLKTLVGNGNLVNVCSYPSAGNGGNNNPFDCIVNPGSGFLKIIKVAGTTTQVFSFTVVPTPSGGNPVNITGSGNSGNLALGFTTTGSVTETVPTNWTLSSASCTKQGGGSTGTFNGTTAVTGITIESGLLTTCTFTNSLANGTLVIIKHVDNTNGGSAVAGNFNYDGGGTSGIDDEAGVESPGTSHSLANGTTFDVAENGVASGKITQGGVVYSVSYSGTCKGTITSGTTATCTITNTSDKATPGITTTMKWTLNDSETLTSFRTGGTGGTATFNLYKDDGANTCTAGTLVYGPVVVNVDNTTGSASTDADGGYTTTTGGTYRWHVVYSGNNLNDGVTSNCTEITTLP